MKSNKQIGEELIGCVKSGRISLNQIGELIELVLFLQKKLEEKERTIRILETRHDRMVTQLMNSRRVDNDS